MEDKKEYKKRKNKVQYTIMTILIIIVFLVIHLSFDKTLREKIYVDVVPKQPTNHIRGIDKEEENPGENDDEDNKDNEKPISYVFTEDKSYGNYIYLINQFPIKDEVGKALEGQYKTFDFKVEFGNKAVGFDYVITLEKMQESDLEDNTWIKAYLTRENEDIPNCYRSNGRIKTFNEYELYNGNGEEVILYKGKVTASDLQRGYRNFRFRMWVSEDVKVYNGVYESKSFIARVNVHASGKI